jgi:hypothetical protein
MRNALLPAAIVALLGLTVDPKPLAAQADQPVWTLPKAPAPTDMVSPDQVEIASPVVHPRHPRHKIRHVVHSPPNQRKPQRKLAENQRKIAENNGYKRLSDLVNFPKFFPGLGILFVKPGTLPLGPFLCFDRRDRLVATLYMVPIKDIDDHKSLEAPGFGGKVDHVSLYFNPGHPGVDVPHYHVVIWHVTKKEEARVAK